MGTLSNGKKGKTKNKLEEDRIDQKKEENATHIALELSLYMQTRTTETK